MNVVNTISIPEEIIDSATRVDDLAAASYHGRIYYFIRGKNGHIFMDWATIMNQLGSTQHFGALHGWEDISPDKTAGGSGITALPSMEGDRLDIFAHNIQKTATGAGGLSSFFSFLFTPQSTGMFRNSLGNPPGNTLFAIIDSAGTGIK